MPLTEAEIYEAYQALKTRYSLYGRNQVKLMECINMIYTMFREQLPAVEEQIQESLQSYRKIYLKNKRSEEEDNTRCYICGYNQTRQILFIQEEKRRSDGKWEESYLDTIHIADLILHEYSMVEEI